MGHGVIHSPTCAYPDFVHLLLTTRASSAAAGSGGHITTAAATSRIRSGPSSTFQQLRSINGYGRVPGTFCIIPYHVVLGPRTNHYNEAPPRQTDAEARTTVHRQCEGTGHYFLSLSSAGRHKASHAQLDSIIASKDSTKAPSSSLLGLSVAWWQVAVQTIRTHVPIQGMPYIP